MERNNPVYLDYNATAPLHPSVRAKLIESLDDYGNPSSVHGIGRSASGKVESAREAVARLIRAQKDSVVFTGGGSESNNSVLNMVTCGDRSCAQFQDERSRLVTSTIEHPSVLNTANSIEAHGSEVTYVGVDARGKIDIEEFEKSLDVDVALVSIMLANNEIGTIQDIRTLAEMAHSHGALMHTDAVQAVGKIDVDVEELGVDFLSLSGHKFGGPKGIGVLYIRSGTPFCNFISGGHQEGGRRGGTLNTPGIVGIGAAADVQYSTHRETESRVRALRDRLRRGIESRVPDIHINGHPTDCLPGTLNISFLGAEGEALLEAAKRWV